MTRVPRLVWNSNSSRSRERSSRVQGFARHVHGANAARGLGIAEDEVATAVLPRLVDPHRAGEGWTSRTSSAPTSLGHAIDASPNSAWGRQRSPIGNSNCSHSSLSKISISALPWQGRRIPVHGLNGSNGVGR